MNKKYSVTGMTCAACSSGIERTVSKLDGVSSCSVSLMGESMDVTFDESKLSDGDIRAAVTSLGYGAKRLQPLFRKPRSWQCLDLFIALVMFSIALTLVLNPLTDLAG